MGKKLWLKLFPNMKMAKAAFNERRERDKRDGVEYIVSDLRVSGSEVDIKYTSPEFPEKFRGMNIDRIFIDEYITDTRK